MALTVLPAADRTPRPWKNGGGVTTDVASWPPGAGLDDFDWRISIARVAQDGPFSVFPGVDRVMAILSGEGLVLEVAGRPPVTLTPASPAIAYPGDVPTAARLVGGPVTDLNVMARRGRVPAALARVAVHGEATLEGPGVFLLAGGAAAIHDGRQRLELGALDGVLSDGARPVAVSGETALGWWMAISG